MTHSIQRIGVLTGGGDCPGLNAAIRAVVKTAIFHHDWEVVGIEDGFLGLLEDRMRPLTSNDASNILTLGGTIIGASNKAAPDRHPVGKDPSGATIYKDVTDECIERLRKHGVDALVVIGGDGTMSITRHFVDLGFPCAGVPKTIDNDLWGADLTIGFTTAVEIATHALDRLHTTASSHHRVMVAEVMGRNAGWIALHAGAASGADVIAIPEIPYDLAAICEYVQHRKRSGKRASIVCISEGATPRGGQQTVAKHDPTMPDPVRLGGVGEILADDIQHCTSIDARAVVLGHVLRGGSPNAADRVLATQCGHRAVELLAAGATDRLVVWHNGRLDETDIRHAADRQRLVPEDHDLIRACRAVGVSFGN